MALANLGRNRKRTVLVIVSMTLSLVLFNTVFTLSGGFDIDKYIAKFMDIGIAVLVFVIAEKGVVFCGKRFFQHPGGIEPAAVLKTAVLSDGFSTWQS